MTEPAPDAYAELRRQTAAAPFTVIASKLEVASLLSERDGLAAENEQLREALAFYAESWRESPSKHRGMQASRVLLADCGKRARQALAPVSKGGEE